MDPILGMAAGTAMNAISEIAMSGFNDQRQVRQQRRLNEEQKKMMDYGMMKQVDLWNATGYKAQMEQLQAAGLNPALMYKGSGAGGSTALAGTGNAAGAPNTAANAPNVLGAAQMGMQLELLKAQKENIEADTRLKGVTATKGEGIDTEVAKGQLEKLAAETGNIKTQGEILKLDEYLKNIEKEIETKSMGMRMAEIQYRTANAWEMLQQAIVKTKLDQGTVDKLIEQVKLETTGLALQNILTGAQTTNVRQDTRLKQEQTKESKERQLMIQREVTNMFQKNEREWAQLGYEQRRTAVQEELSRLAGRQVDLNEAEQFIRILDMGMGKAGGGRNIIEGFTPNKRY